MLPIIVTLVEIIVLSFALTGILLVVLLGLRILPGLSKGDSLYSIFCALVKAPEEKPLVFIRDSRTLSPMAAALLVSMYLSSTAAQTTYAITMPSRPTVSVTDRALSSDSASNLVVVPVAP